MADATHTGSCQCGGITIKISGDPLWTGRCHCSDCRKATGAEAAAFAGFLLEHTTITGTTFKEHESSPGVFRGFCDACGSRLTYRAPRWPDQLHIHIGAMKTPDAFAPGGNAMTSEKLGWVRLEEDLPAFAKYSD